MAENSREERLDQFRQRQASGPRSGLREDQLARFAYIMAFLDRIIREMG
jgi:hypothetical protein